MSISFLKKIRHIIDSKVSAYIFKRYPYFIEFLHSYIDFMDENYTIEALNFDRNSNANEMFDRFLDEAWNQYCVQMIDSNEIKIPDTEDGEETKRLFLTLSKLLYQNKGKAYSFDVILRYLTKFSVNGGAGVTDGVEYTLSEHEEYWHSQYNVFVSKITPYDRPYTYRIEIDDEDRYMIQSLVEKYTPTGFWMIWVYKVLFEETLELDAMSELLNVSINPLLEETSTYTSTETLELEARPLIEEKFSAMNYYDAKQTYDADIQYTSERGYAIETMDITYHHTTNPDINESFL